MPEVPRQHVLPHQVPGGERCQGEAGGIRESNARPRTGAPRGGGLGAEAVRPRPEVRGGGQPHDAGGAGGRPDDGVLHTG